MNNKSFSIKTIFQLLLIACVGLVGLQANAQFTATWALTSNKTVVVAGAQSSMLTSGDMVPGTDFPNPGSHNTDGYQCAITTGSWPTVATNGMHVDFPFSPVGNADITLSGLTLTTRTSGSSGNNLISLAYQKNGTGPWVPFASAIAAPSGGTNNISFGSFTQKFYSGNTYVIRMYVYAQGSGTTSSRTVRLKNVVFTGSGVTPAGTAPSVTTNTATATGLYTATATGNLTAGTLLITESGFCWSTVTNPTVSLTTKTTNGPTATGAMNANITGLTAGTTYYVRAYATSESGETVYGSVMSFTTQAPVIPSVTTAAVTNILSNRATSGGAITDSGGVPVTAKGICWSTTANPTTANSKTTNGTGNDAFVAMMKGLTPATTYYVRAYATNSIGTAYGNQVQFTTAAAVPVIETTPDSLDFGGVIVNKTSNNLSYTLKASYLTPAVGSLTLNAPAGFLISLSPNTGFAASINVPYTGATISGTTIYVRFNPTQFGQYSGTITHTGGGAAAIDIVDMLVKGFGIQSPTELSNTGTDFWVGYGYQALMSTSNNQEMVLYISSKQDAVVTVEIPGIGYSQTYNVTANVAFMTNPIPKFTGQDARLNSTGILNKGIHVYSNGVPVSVWAHIFASQSSGATMVLPTNTWGSDYTVLTIGGQTNSGIPHSFFFVMAAEDNTVIDITPSADITATAQGTTILYPAGVTFSVTLNKGEVFNALGKLNSSSNGVDLTGTKVKARDCKKIALFTGNGRVQLSVGGCSFTDGGSDNLIQQMFPKASWGNQYLTVPFKDMEAGFYRVVVSDPATVVKVNGVALAPAQLINNFYYQIETAEAHKVEADKPVMVAQFCATHKCNGTGIAGYPVTGNYGDPEMVILSPVQQAINDVTVFSASQYAIQRNYINVIVKNSGVASFELDGVNVSSSFVPHPNDPGYSYAQFSGLAGGVSHRLTSTEIFNAIAYGFTNDNNHESYGYNAGTYLRDLSTKLLVQTPFAKVPTTATCKNNDFKFRVAIPNPPANVTSLTWDFGNNPNLTPNATEVQNNPISDSTATEGGSTLYFYSTTNNYQFAQAGTYQVRILVNGITPDGCTGVREYNFDVVVKEGFQANFNAPVVCIGDSTKLYDITDGLGSTIVKWNWQYSDATKDSVKNPVKLFTVAGTYSVKLQVINDAGCYDDTTKNILVAKLPVANFTVNPTGCVNVAQTFTNTSTSADGTITNWKWNYGVGADVNVTNGNAQSYTYANPGTYNANLQVTSQYGCKSTVVPKTINIYKTTAAFTVSSPVCIGTPLVLTESSNGGGSTVNSWSWNFGNSTTSTQQLPSNISYANTGNYTVTLTATSQAGCVGTATNTVNVLATLSNPVVTVTDSSLNSVTFSWAPVAGATGYLVSVNGGNFNTPSSGATGTTHVAGGFQPNQTVNIQVKALGVTDCQQSIGTASGKTLLPDMDVFVPNTFTPNGDGMNDVLKVYSNYIKAVTIRIYNQWGQLIFTGNDNGKGWDGIANGKPQPVGVYVYVVRVIKNDGTVVDKKGTVNLIR